ncbi:hypothetical protein ACO22_00448 [Paracoccidioides brasiliensis]|uniref:Uncharacterized protein n=1 Tax=Paracoccidioides brasiliensis TaxID=121759 RepID=A0A1D2JPB4_PARBR|nr:hypothetical protein ACO22_00448 [Paracoccidioides brasiliensis]
MSLIRFAQHFLPSISEDHISNESQYGGIRMSFPTSHLNTRVTIQQKLILWHLYSSYFGRIAEEKMEEKRQEARLDGELLEEPRNYIKAVV